MDLHTRNIPITRKQLCIHILVISKGGNIPMTRKKLMTSICANVKIRNIPITRIKLYIVTVLGR